MGGRQRAAPSIHNELLPLVVVGRKEAARDTVTLWLATPGGQGAPTPYAPGQFITLAMPTPRGTLYRSYSLCGAGDSAQPWEIAVKRQRAGAVSSYLYGHARPGMVLYATPPRGSFTLPVPLPMGTPLIFVAVGSGITPIYGMLRFLARLPRERRPRAQLHYASAAHEDVIYGPELLALDPSHDWLRQYYYLHTRGERFNPAQALAAAAPMPQAAQWLICGPEEFKGGMYEALARAGVPAARIRAEVFGDERAPGAVPRRPAAAGGSVVGHLQLADTGATLDLRAGEPLLTAMERQGLRPDASCRAGECGVCRVRLLAGRVRDPGAGLTPPERAAGYVLACVAEPQGDVTLASAGGAAAGPGGAAGRRAAVTVLRAGLVASAAALFLAIAQQTNAHPTAPALPDIGLPGGVGTQATPTTPSGIATQPSIPVSPPNASTGVS
jgi:ferredoxin-NADP reductase